MFNQKEYDLAENGEIVSTKSALAFDEDIACRQCGHIFPLIEGNWQGEHPKFKRIEAHGIKCPNCGRVNITYVKTPKLKTLENKINNAPTDEKAQAYRAKYQKLFRSVQKKFGRVDVAV